MLLLPWFSSKQSWRWAGVRGAQEWVRTGLHLHVLAAQHPRMLLKQLRSCRVERAQLELLLRLKS